ncbi:uncharacterized protein BO66DRAFT_79129 [Aspergillus aculeatinus CBS 121060]|uniref:Uncharacterized protein n=1 Tax=Aspergillus aculeatinus CBS 121060 TaxID=1448322 RepID=A0ACD1HBH2_9EURO|nr:hypothetical protein BO66DRAFT_79129 [Aspergillus aculeatinus CBS 121060]RAH70720.1 hypothetical protein BO66DRAFT_79129 [Aspergillus aculeatinus CBS 121060]
MHAVGCKATWIVSLGSLLAPPAPPSRRKGFHRPCSCWSALQRTNLLFECAPQMTLVRRRYSLSGLLPLTPCRLWSSRAYTAPCVSLISRFR